MAPLVFSGIDSYFRLCQLQDLCGPKSLYQSIIVVGGLDGQQNSGSQAILKYLFLGKTGQELLGDQVIEEQASALEDSILVITYSSVSIYYNYNARHLILPIISNWKNVTEYELEAAFTDDVGQSEMFKIDSFVMMTRGKEKTSLPLGSADPMASEKWPIIQAYGLDEKGQRGFFTMNHTVMDCLQDVHKVMAQVDEFAARRFVYESEPLLRKHWQEFLRSVDHVEHAHERTVKAEQDIAEDLISFYEFGTVRHSARGLPVRKERKTRLLLGTHSNDLEDESGRKTAEDLGVGSFPATHFVVEAEDPTTGLRAARTHFLASGKIAPRIVDTNALVRKTNSVLDKYASEPDNSADTGVLKDLYVLILKGLECGISSFIDAVKMQVNAKVIESEALKAAIEAIRKNWSFVMNDATYSGISPDFIAQNLSLEAKYMDSRGEPTTGISEGSWNIVYLKLYIKNIPSQVASGGSVGAVLVGDSIVFNQETSSIVTRHIPYFRSWINSGKEAAFANGIDNVLLSEHMLEEALFLGKEVGETVYSSYALFDSDIFPLASGTIRGYEDGFVFRTPAFNPIVVSFRQNIKQLSVISTPESENLLFVVEFNEDDESWVEKSFPIRARSSTIALPLVSDSASFETLYNILASWKQSSIENDIPFHRPADDEDSSSKRLLDKFSHGCKELAYLRGQAKDPMIFPKWFIPPLTNLSSRWTNKTSKGPIPVSVVLGIPGSDVDKIALGITNMSAATNCWTTINIVSRDHGEDVRNAIVGKLTAAVDDMYSTSRHETRPRIMLAITAFIDPMEVVRTLKSIQKLPQPIRISTLSACVSAVNVYATQEAFVTYPFVFEQCSSAFADHVIVTRCGDALQEHMAALRVRIERSNPAADHYFVSGDAFEVEISSLVQTECFENSYKVQFREALYRGWMENIDKYICPLEKSINSVRFLIELPFDRNRFLTYVSSMTPKAILRTVGSTAINPIDEPNTKELSGIRLAQALAKSKVQEARSLQVSKAEAKKTTTEELCGRVWSVFGTVMFDDDVADKRVYEYLASGTRASVRPATTTRRNDTCILMFTGVNLKASGLHAALLECFPHKHPVDKIRSRSSVTMEERRVLQKKHELDPLPEGYLYDGTGYVDFIGNKLQFHPKMDQFIENFLQDQNATQQKHNKAAVDEQKSAEGALKQF